jgi:hypothetical protein
MSFIIFSVHAGMQNSYKHSKKCEEVMCAATEYDIPAFSENVSGA